MTSMTISPHIEAKIGELMMESAIKASKNPKLRDIDVWRIGAAPRSIETDDEKLKRPNLVKIVAALAERGPLTTRELSGATGIRMHSLKNMLRDLRHFEKITTTGASIQSRTHQLAD
uniref:hypothetical protein n=1 Tax=Yoonia sp. TaxID=2212373 RepID=UPI004048B665